MSRSLRYVVLFTILSSILLTPMTSSAQKSAPVRHVVVFKYKKDASTDKIAQVTRAFRELRSKIPGITAFEAGVNNSPEGKNLGFTHVYLLTFESVAARDAYLPHPEHKKFGELLGKLAVLEDAFVVDYVAGS
jgi:hypothetical protein